MTFPFNTYSLSPIGVYRPLQRDKVIDREVDSWCLFSL